MNIYKDDFYIGKRFKYMGVIMLVTELGNDRRMRVDYVDNRGRLVHHIFSEYDHPAVVSEHNRTGDQY